MRPGQNRRMRGRNNSGGNNSGNRKAPNPLQRSYESNGPDVKVRGTAQHVAEKYLQLARDAQSSGDPVAAENYFQHAEHYYRILLAAQEQMSQQFGHTFPPNRAFVEDADEGDEDGDEDVSAQAFPPGAGPQPDIRFGQGGNGYNGNNPQRAEGEAGEGGQNGQRFDRQGQGRDRFNDRNNNNRRFDRNDRQDRGERRFDRNPEQGQPAPGGYAPRPDALRSDIPVDSEQPAVAAATEPGQSPVQGERRFDRGPRPERRPRRERPVDAEASDEEAAALPSFLTTPVRVPAAAPVEAPVEVVAEPVAEAVEGPSEAAPAKRARRRRSPREVMDALGQEVDGPAE